MRSAHRGPLAERHCCEASGAVGWPHRHWCRKPRPPRSTSAMTAESSAKTMNVRRPVALMGPLLRCDKMVPVCGSSKIHAGVYVYGANGVSPRPPVTCVPPAVDPLASTG